MKIKATHKIHQRITKKAFLIVVAAIAVIGFGIIFSLFSKLKSKNVTTPNHEDVSLFIPTNADFQTVKDSLYAKGLIKNRSSFEFVAKTFDYDKYVKPGHYIIKDGYCNQQLISILRSGCQTPVDVIFNNIRTVEQLAGRISQAIEADSTSILNEIRNDNCLKAEGFNEYNYASLFIPNTYEFYWNTDAKGFLKRMKREYKCFWTESRMQKAKNINLTPLEVSTLASIIDKETTKVSEMRTIAGVYLNRLKKHWLLQADPTLVFACGNYDIQRILDYHKNIDSPYNTYKYTGLPPGPICIPSIDAIDAVLNAEKHRYFYFCAKDDLSGSHVFAKSLNEHNINAEKYRRALNKQKIYK